MSLKQSVEESDLPSKQSNDVDKDQRITIISNGLVKVKLNKSPVAAGNSIIIYFIYHSYYFIIINNILIIRLY
jgi:hypothetical protein